MKGIIGAISGDVIGSVYENRPIKTKNFNLFGRYSCFTDDTVMTLAVANWLCEDKTSKDVLIENLKYFGNAYLNAGYGPRFYDWLNQESPEPYGSWANGSAMRVSPCAWAADSLEEAQSLAKTSAEIRQHVELRYGYNLSLSLDEIRPTYEFDISCKGSVPESIICFLEADDFEDTIRNAVSLGGDADTQAAIAGSIASAYWDVPDDIYDETIDCLDHFLLGVLMDFDEKFM